MDGLWLLSRWADTFSFTTMLTTNPGGLSFVHVLISSEQKCNWARHGRSKRAKNNPFEEPLAAPGKGRPPDHRGASSD
jgi:hypothetical protein